MVKKFNGGRTAATPEEIAVFFKAETERWRKVIVSSGIKPDRG
jgi:hypothetical protein